MEKIKLMCSTCNQIINKNEIHNCGDSSSKRKEYIVNKKVKTFSLNFFKLKK